MNRIERKLAERILHAMQGSMVLELLLNLRAISNYLVDIDDLQYDLVVEMGRTAIAGELSTEFTEFLQQAGEDADVVRERMERSLILVSLFRDLTATLREHRDAEQV